MRQKRKRKSINFNLLKKETSAFMIAVLLIVQSIYGLGLAAASSITTNILTNVTMTVYSDNNWQDPVTDTVYKQRSKVTLDYNWDLPDGHGYHDGDTFTFQLPDVFQLYNDVSGNLVLPGTADSVGTFAVDRSTHQVVMTFNDYIEHYDVYGTLSFKTEFREFEAHENSVQEIILPVNGVMEKILLTFEPKNGALLAKRGWADDYNPKNINWEVDVNTSLNKITNAVVTDLIPPGLGLPDPASVVVKRLNVTMGGTATPGETVTAGTYYTYNGSASPISFSFLNPQDTVTNNTYSAYRISFTTPITDASIESFLNTATLTGSNLSTSPTAAATVETKYGEALNKSTGNYSNNTQTIEWAVEFNYDERTLAAGASLEDWFSDNQTEPSEIKVYPVEFAMNGSNVTTTVRDTPIDPGEYTVTSLSDPANRPGQAGIRLTFGSAVSSAYKIVYVTKAKERVYADNPPPPTVTNTVYFETKSTEPVVRTLTSGILTKGQSVDYSNKTIDWTITFNDDKKPDGSPYKVQDTVITDTLPSGVMLDQASLKIVNGAYQLQPVTDYTLTITPDGFKIELKNAYKTELIGACVITYTTSLDRDLLLNSSTYPNTAHVAWVENSTFHQQQVTEVFTPNERARNNGFKNGTYNATTKEITWNVGFNYNQKNVAAANIVDPFLHGQKLVSNSVKIYEMNIANGGNPTKGNPVAPSKYTVELPDETNGNILTISFKDAGTQVYTPITQGYYLEFKTTLDGLLIESNITNKAALYDGGNKISNDLTATVNIPHRDIYLNKIGTQDGTKIKWKVEINYNQSTIWDAVITDTGSANQLLDQGSFRLYKTTVAADGAVTKGSPLQQGADKDYTVSFSHNSNGEPVFILAFLEPSPIAEPYILEYESYVVANDGEVVTNSVGLSGRNISTVTKNESQNVTVRFSSGQGTGSGVVGSLTITKKDHADPSTVLPGAQFSLYRVIGTVQALVGTYTTDIHGEITIAKLNGGSYILKETAAPAGYQLDNTPRSLVINSVTKDVVFEATNKKIAAPSPSVSPSASTGTGTSPSPSTGTGVSPSPSTGTGVSPSPSTGTGVSPSPSTGTGVTPSPSTGTGVTPSPSTGTGVTPSPSTGTGVTPSPSTGTGVTPSPSTGTGPTPSASTGTSPTPDSSTEENPTPTPSTASSPTPSASTAVSPTPSTAVSPTPVTPEPSPSTPAASPSPTPLTETEVTDENTPKGGSVEVPEGSVPSIGKVPQNGTLTVDENGNWLYTPDPGFTGKDEFSIIITDEDGNEEEIIIEIDVNEIPLGTIDPPEEEAVDVKQLPKTGEPSNLPWQATGLGLIIGGIALKKRYGWKKQS
ncbi:MAG: hypothetical protein K0R57_4191 [Paenibacillaceae bacterium]|jgi:uncharacterized surface anchored protein|nr:hypothetical protein [Paenibacillaceae bacterium]